MAHSHLLSEGLKQEEPANMRKIIAVETNRRQTQRGHRGEKLLPLTDDDIKRIADAVTAGVLAALGCPPDGSGGYTVVRAKV